MMAEVSAERGRATRQRLLDAAVALIGEVGWNAVTTRMVADRAGVNPGLVHYHFSSVTDLLVAAATGFAERMLGDFSQRLAEMPDVPTGVDWVLGELSEYSGTDPASLLLIEAVLAAGRLPGLRARLGATVAAFRVCMADWLRRQGHGAAEAEMTATVFAAAVDGIVLHRAVDPAMNIAALAGPLRRLLAPGVPER